MGPDFVQSLAVATDAQRYRIETAEGGAAFTVTRTTALIAVMLVNDQVQKLGREAGLDWGVLLEGADLKGWSAPTDTAESSPEDDAPFYPRALSAIDTYADRFGRERPVIDTIGLGWGLVGEQESVFEDRLRKAGADVEQFRSLLFETIASELQDVPESGSDETERREGVADRRSGDSDRRASEDAPSGSVTDKLRTLTDAPAEVDLLNRRPLAESLATRLRTTRVDDPQASFLLHVDGPWGSGKSTLLNFLQDELEKDSLVVYFNAWREQRAGPPWWGLLSTLRRAAIDDGGKRYRARESIWMLKGLGIRFWVAAVTATLVIGAILVWATGDAISLDALGKRASSLAAIAALGATMWALVVRLGRRTAPGSLNSATRYLENQQNPMQAIADRFNAVVDLAHKPVVLFVDDLDRCSSAYVVEFLEALQTVVRETPRSPGIHAPHLVVAADGRWIRASYEREYADFVGVVTYPGRPLGYLFLDKAFQLTTTLPAIDENQRQHYWEQLLQIESIEDEASYIAAPGIAQSILQDATTDADILDLVDERGEDDPVLQSALRAEAVKRMAEPSLASSTEHELREYADLLDPNPRAMKRFVNAYGVERALRTIEGRRPRSDQLARWIIVQLRWPLLAEVLRSDLAAITLIGTDPDALVDLDQERLFGVVDLIDDPDVVRTILDPDPKYGHPLDAEGIKESAGL
jgi:hypothetical protein